MNWRLSYSNEESVKRRSRSRSKREAGGGGTSWRVGDFWSGSGRKGKLTACRPEGIFYISVKLRRFCSFGTKTFHEHRRTAENIGKHQESYDIILRTTEDPS